MRSRTGDLERSLWRAEGLAAAEQEESCWTRDDRIEKVTGGLWMTAISRSPRDVPDT